MVIFTYNLKTYNMTDKQKIIKKAEALLKECGFTQQDYVISLQGPTVILAKSGRELLEKDLTIKADLMWIGIQIL